MKRDMTHDEAAELIADAALDALTPGDQEAVLAHAATCAQCGPALATLRNAISQLAFAVPSVADDPVRRARVRTRLLARARADLAVANGGRGGAWGSERIGPGVVAAASVDSDAPRRSWLASPGLGWGLALAAGLVGILAVYRRGAMDDWQLTQVAQQRDSLAARVEALHDSIAARDQLVAAVTGKQISSNATHVGHGSRALGLDVLGSCDESLDAGRPRSGRPTGGEDVSTVARDAARQDQRRHVRAPARRVGRGPGDLRPGRRFAPGGGHHARAGGRRAPADGPPHHRRQR